MPDINPGKAAYNLVTKGLKCKLVYVGSMLMVCKATLSEDISRTLSSKVRKYHILS